MGACIGSIAAWTRQQDAVGVAGEGERSQRRRCQAVDVGALSFMGAEGFVEAVEAAQILLVVVLDRSDELFQAGVAARLSSHG